ncbi:hypothetical protein CBL_02065 [Carabus blaptoides fortunei]
MSEPRATHSVINQTEPGQIITGTGGWRSMACRHQHTSPSHRLAVSCMIDHSQVQAMTCPLRKHTRSQANVKFVELPDVQMHMAGTKAKREALIRSARSVVPICDSNSSTKTCL